jgi:hypothetical protein
LALLDGERQALGRLARFDCFLRLFHQLFDDVEIVRESKRRRVLSYLSFDLGKLKLLAGILVLDLEV